MSDLSEPTETEERVTARSIFRDPVIRTVVIVQFVYMLGLGVVFPYLTLYARSFDVSFAVAGILGSAFGLSRLCADLVAGPIVDKRGERPVALFGMGLLSVCALLTGIAPNYPMAVVFWSLGGIGSAVTFAAQYSYILKSVPKQYMARTLGVFYGAFNSGVIAGGIIGGIAADRFGLRMPFFIYSGVLAIAYVMYVRLVPDRPGKVTPPPLNTEEVLLEREGSLFRRSTSGIRGLFKLPGFFMAVALNFCYLWMIAAILDTLLPLFADERLHLSEGTLGLVFAVAVAAEFTILYPAGSWSDRFGRKPVLIPGLIGLIIVSVAIGWATGLASLLVVIAVHGVASGLAGVPPAAVLSDVVPQEKSGTGVGVFRFAGDLAFFLAPGLAGLLAEAFGFKSAFALSTIPMIIVLVIVLMTPETLRRPETNEER